MLIVDQSLAKGDKSTKSHSTEKPILWGMMLFERMHVYHLIAHTISLAPDQTVLLIKSIAKTKAAKKFAHL